MINFKNQWVVSMALSLGLFASPTLAGGGPGPVQPGDLLASTGNIGNSLIDLDPDTAETRFRFGLGSLGPVTEIRFRSDGVLFATTGEGASNVIIIDPDTGTETLVGQHQFGAVNGLAFIGETLYGAFYDAGDEGQGSPDGFSLSMFLVIVDQDDGSLTVVGQLEDFSRVRGLAYDPDAGILYGAGTFEGALPSGGGPVTGDVLFTINPATAATSFIGDTGYGIGAISFGPDGQLYAGAVGGGMILGQNDIEGEPIQGAPLLILDTDTGAATVVGTTEAPAISGLDFAPGGQATPASIAVPTLATWSLILMALLLAMLGARTLMRPHTKA
jgi:DNA-binding beta-propeller fold protein YncE